MEKGEEVCSMEDTVKALLDHFVEPFLPIFSAKQAPTPSNHHTIAKQMNAVVLLYNYYHRKRWGELKFLDFTSFCKLAVVLKPNLMHYMKFMHRAGYSEMNVSEDKLSETEKAVVNACNLSSALDASKSVPVIVGWPVSKVAVFILDLRKVNCKLLYGPVTDGVWSLIEKDLEVSSVNENDADEARLLDLALLAVKDATGIDKSDLVVTESRIVYSLNKPKETVRLYVMQCTQSINDDISIPINGLIGSLQGPLVQKNSHGWTVTPLANYFHVLPYMEALLDWHSRYPGESVCSSTSDQAEQVDGPQQMDVNSSDAVFSQGRSETQNSHGAVEGYQRLKNEGHRRTSPGSFAAKAEATQSLLKPCPAGCNNDMIGTRNGSKSSLLHPAMQGGNGLMADPPSQIEHRGWLRADLNPGNVISQSNLNILYWQRQKLREYLKTLETEIMVYDMAIETVSNGGDEWLSRNFPMVVDTILKKEEIQQTDANPHRDDGLQGHEKEKNGVESQCKIDQSNVKKLDELCHKKNWALPTYRIFPFADGYLANVNLNRCNAFVRKTCSSPSAAREMAAELMIAKIGDSGESK